MKVYWGTDCQADTWVQSAAAQLDWVVGFIGGAIRQRREGILPKEQQGHCLSVITRWNRLISVVI
jgi:hypothetical protein